MNGTGRHKAGPFPSLRFSSFTLKKSPWRCEARILSKAWIPTAKAFARDVD